MSNPNPSPETRFKDGNPGGPGKPKGSGIRSLIRQIVDEPLSSKRTKGEAIAGTLINKAVKGNLGAIGMVIDNVDGKLVQPIEPLDINFTFTTKEKEEGDGEKD